MARRINAEVGGLMVTPWDVYDLPDEVLDVFEGLAELPSMKKSVEQVHGHFERFRRNAKYRM